jgi:hypothetical protein
VFTVTIENIAAAWATSFHLMPPSACFTGLSNAPRHLKKRDTTIPTTMEKADEVSTSSPIREEEHHRVLRSRDSRQAESSPYDTACAESAGHWDYWTRALLRGRTCLGWGEYFLGGENSSNFSRDYKHCRVRWKAWWSYRYE